jgi:hypothetical protein
VIPPPAVDWEPTFAICGKVLLTLLDPST